MVTAPTEPASSQNVGRFGREGSRRIFSDPSSGVERGGSAGRDASTRRAASRKGFPEGSRLSPCYAIERQKFTRFTPERSTRCQEGIPPACTSREGSRRALEASALENEV